MEDSLAKHFLLLEKEGGFDDTRGTLFFDCARILKEKQPRNFILENVKGLLSHDSGRTFKTIINTLAELGYCVEWQVLNAKNFGVPQNRERVFIVGHLGGIPERKVFPITRTDREIDEPSRIQSVSNPRELSRTLLARDYKDPKVVRIGGLYDNEKGKHQAGSIYDTSGISGTLDTAQGGNRQPFIRNPYNGKQSEVESGTLGTSCGTTTGKTAQLLHKDTRIRRLTPLECERLMGYPDGWTENGLSDTMEICVNINNAIENKLLELDTVSNITSDGKGMVFPIYQLEQKKNVNIVLEELVQEDGAINTINLGNAMATLFNRKGILQNATELKENLIYGRTEEKSIYKLWKVKLVGHYEKEKLFTILTWINETMIAITSISARIDENIIGVIIHWNKSELNSLKKEQLYLRMGNINSISDTQRYKTLGNGIVSNVVAEVVKRIYKNNLLKSDEK